MSLGRAELTAGKYRALSPLLLLLGLAGALLASSCGGPAASGPPHTKPPVVSTTTTSPPASASTLPPSSTTTTPSTTSPPAPTTTTPARPTVVTLSLGSSGPAVVRLQERLLALHYWLAGASGSFDDSTEQAVYALQKAAGIPADGIVGPLTWSALTAGREPNVRPAAGYVVEVNLEKNLVLFTDNGALVLVLNTSTGGGYTYYQDGYLEVANTPTGHFRILRAVDGLVVSSLGELWRPRYFYEGFAIHGDAYVPPEPVSHGCVRVSNEAIDWIWARGLLPIGGAVWIY